MPQVDRSAFDGKEIERIFVGTSMSECSKAEAVLSAVAIDYLVEVEPIQAGLFSRSLTGAVFYVLAGQAEYCRSRLESEGLSFGLIQPE